MPSPPATAKTLLPVLSVAPERGWASEVAPASLPPLTSCPPAPVVIEEVPLGRVPLGTVPVPTVVPAASPALPFVAEEQCQMAACWLVRPS